MTIAQNNVNQNLTLEILSLLSEAISYREKKSVKLNDIMEYEEVRTSISNFEKKDIITEYSEGSIALKLDNVLLPKEEEELRKSNKVFFSK